MLSTPEKQTRDAFTRPPSCGNDQEAKDGAKGSPLLAGIKERNCIAQLQLHGRRCYYSGA